MKSKFCYYCRNIDCRPECRKPPEYLSVYLIGYWNYNYKASKINPFLPGTLEFVEFEKGHQYLFEVGTRQNFYIIMYYRGTNDIHHVVECTDTIYSASLRAREFTRTTEYDACLEIDH